jgi:hypothetical protein
MEMETLTMLARRLEAADSYKPDDVRMLLVAEAPPGDESKYFYFEEVAAHDALFRYVARGVLGEEPTRENKPILLKQLRAKGVFLIDVKLEPLLPGEDLRPYVPDLVRRVRDLDPARVVLIKATVFDAAYGPLKEAGLPVVGERIPFPGSGRQREFEVAFARALNA